MYHKLNMYKLLAAAFAISIVLGGCRLFSSLPAGNTTPPPAIPSLEPNRTEETSSQAPSGTPGQTPASPHSTDVPSSQAALDACDLESQAAAMRPDHLPDWEKIGINTCYDLVFDLTGGGPDYAGTAKITYTNTGSSALPDIVLRLYPNSQVIYGGSLELIEASVQENTLDAEVFLYDETAVRLFLPRPLGVGETIELQLSFQGSLPVDFSSAFSYGIFNYSSEGPVLVMANAYPILAVRENNGWRSDPVNGMGDAVLSETALYKASVRAPEDWQIATTGRILTSDAQAGVRTISASTGPVREFMLAASPAFRPQEREVQDLQLRYWGPLESASGSQKTLDVAVNSMSLFEDDFGPYPYRELDILTVPLNLASGVEYPGLILLATDLYDDSSRLSRLPTVIAHEAAHQWWYALVGSDVLRHPWQDEALATFSAQLYEQTYDRAFYLGTDSYYRQSVEKIEAELGKQKIDQPLENFNDNPQAYGAVVYLKGSLFFEAVREELGEEQFLGALQIYFQQNQYQEATPADLLGSFENACNCSLDSIYQEWGVE